MPIGHHRETSIRRVNRSLKTFINTSSECYMCVNIYYLVSVSLLKFIFLSWAEIL